MGRSVRVLKQGWLLPSPTGVWPKVEGERERNGLSTVWLGGERWQIVSECDSTVGYKKNDWVHGGREKNEEERMGARRTKVGGF
jgi:hypothetical protein